MPPVRAAVNADDNELRRDRQQPAVEFTGSTANGQFTTNNGGCENSQINHYQLQFWDLLARGVEKTVTIAPPTRRSWETTLDPGYYYIFLWAVETSPARVESGTAVEYHHQPEPVVTTTQQRAASAPRVNDEIDWRTGSWTCTAPDPCDRTGWLQVSDWSAWSQRVRLRPFPTDAELRSITARPAAVTNFRGTRQGGSWNLQWDSAWNGGLPLEKYELGWMDGQHSPCSGHSCGRRPYWVRGSEKSSYSITDYMSTAVDGLAIRGVNAAGAGECTIFLLPPIVSIEYADPRPNPWVPPANGGFVRLQSVTGQGNRVTFSGTATDDGSGTGDGISVNGTRWGLRPDRTETWFGLSQSLGPVTSERWDKVTVTTPAVGTRGRPTLRAVCYKNEQRVDCAAY